MKTGVERRTRRGTAGGGRGIWEAAGAGQVERGAKDLLGFKVPEAKKWRAKFPRAGGTWGAKTPLGVALCSLLSRELGWASKAGQRGAARIG